MKNIFRKSCMLLATGMLLASCEKFDELNVDPLAANADQAQIEYFINTSIISAQMNPDVAERSFVLYWKTAAHQQEDEGLSSGYYNDGWTTAYYNQVSGWLNAANTAVQLANGQIEAGTEKAYTQNLLQVARIWRAYLMSEMSDNFGPIPINAFQGVNPDFSDTKTVYYFILDELKDASSKLDVSVVNPDGLSKQDPAYGYDYAKWKKYANSMRMRLAMRLSEVDPAKAQAEFEDAAASNDFITTADETFKVQERPGWDALTGVMSREWNPQFLSATLFNIYFGLGGIKSEEQLPAALHTYIKPANWMGVKYENHFATKTNDPSAGYWFDGLPYTIDPRAYETFIIPGYFSNPDFSSYPSWTNSAKTTKRDLVDDNGNVVKEIDAAYTWNPSINGDWGAKGAKNKVVYYFEGTVPRLSQEFRDSQNQRIFFAPWETYFLLAEAAERGWSTPISAKEAYETGIAKSFEYWGVPLGSYLSSQDYNRVGTSVSWDHTVEPSASYSMEYKNGYTGENGVATVLYPDNDLYKNGSVKNDHLTKIITQKFIAQTPWLPLEAWNDQRRLGLPFFENPAVENPIVDLPALTQSNYMTSQIEFFPQRLKYPSSLQNTNANGYRQAVGFLGGEDNVLTPLWWAQHE
ncbi:SusD/RagB family nutrient-binding outer membrane lipoprotein [Pontibacter sp. 172403-2]|uniref:SusD/RagB family nutrient-binding outer membrane lipoprotein n=1 Tax=Pontibacter rufus TaxID=2791028 RepID=UPI0018AFC1B2|nr:SusD/RagB family nutrient-binding outer membrane lipoprotein [Pontibacter sp. 172403-2]MBF9252690.1 SusD/RagB family nutrient-binding outer membrane lipoprotein [Pontibacter sp. 172403-2]